ncbi:P-loop containing nucleoside triphosphate hydrolase protein [Ganoderma leucocontextum]|nr:P-loop containing nucleoside triphosphate hydrolase protein [Ganoderma leucocontextum]
MPRIRKKTSKRVAIHRREKVKKKVKETRRKKIKVAKKNPQWKSKHAKDPGIPNNFPYKDQILAEVAEQRRVAVEEKQRRKDEKKAAKSQAAEDGEDEDQDEDTFDGVKAIAAQRAVEAEDEEGEEMDVDEDEDDVPVLINPDLPNLKVVLDAADVVVEVLDARDPPSCRSAHLEEVARELGKKVLLVLNKIDACPREAVEAWAATLRQEHPTVLFRSSTACLPVSPADTWSKGKGKERERADDAWGLDSLTALLQQWATEKKGDEPLTLAVVGVTNAGKTSFVNSLLRKAALQTYKLASSTNDFSPTTTTHPQEVTVDLEGGKSLRIIDTPGLLWHYAEDLSDEDAIRIRARDILLRNRGHIERLKDPSAVMSELVSRSSREDLMLMYNLPIFMEGDATAFLSSLARANGFIKKKGNPDLTGAARTVLRDWSSGKLVRYTAPSHPTPSCSNSSDQSLADVYAKDASVLSKLSTRKELRKSGGLVKLRTGEVDVRKGMLDAGYFVSPSDDADEEDGGASDDVDEVGLSGDESEGSDAEEGSDDEEDEGEEVEGDEDEDEDEEEVDELESSPPPGKRKRALAKAPAPPAKRVAFAPEPRGTKQARSAAGAKGAVMPASKAKLNAKTAKPAARAAKKPGKAATKAAPKIAAPKKVANAASSKRSAASAAKNGEVAYDFKQFF